MVANRGGTLSVTPSRGTGPANEAALRSALAGANLRILVGPASRPTARPGGSVAGWKTGQARR